MDNRASGQPKVQPGGIIVAQRQSVVVQLYQFIHPPGPACILSPHEALEGLDYLCSLQLLLAAVTPTLAKRRGERSMSAASTCNIIPVYRLSHCCPSAETDVNFIKLINNAL